MSSSRFYLTKRSNQIWYLGWIENGRRRWKSTKCRKKADALRYLREHQDVQAQPRAELNLLE